MSYQKSEHKSSEERTKRTGRSNGNNASLPFDRTAARSLELKAQRGNMGADSSLQSA